MNWSILLAGSGPNGSPLLPWSYLGSCWHFTISAFHPHSPQSKICMYISSFTMASFGSISSPLINCLFCPHSGTLWSSWIPLIYLRARGKTQVLAGLASCLITACHCILVTSYKQLPGWCISLWVFIFPSCLFHGKPSNCFFCSRNFLPHPEMSLDFLALCFLGWSLGKSRPYISDLLCPCSSHRSPLPCFLPLPVPCNCTFVVAFHLSYSSLILGFKSMWYMGERGRNLAY